MRRAAFATLFFAVVLFAASSDARLPEAAMQGDRDAVRSLIAAHVDINAAQGDGMTALHWAADKRDVEMARMLLTAGAMVNAATRLGAITPLFIACSNGDARMIEILLNAGADANSTKANGATALMIAAASGNADAVKVLLDHGAEANAKESVHGQTALMFAAALNRDQAIRILLVHGADPKIATKVNKIQRVRLDADGNPILPPAGQKPTADALPQKTAANANGTSLAGATLAGASEEHAIGPDSMGGMTALLYAAREGHVAAIKALLDGGADVNELNPGDNVSPLLIAITNAHFDIAMLLLDRGADPNPASTAGLAPLFAAIDVQWVPHSFYPQPLTSQEKTTYLELMGALLKHGANPNARILKNVWFRGYFQNEIWVGSAGATAFWRAAQAADVPAMKLLVKYGADPKIPTTQGVTPLMVASGLGWAANFSENASDSWLAAARYCYELGNDVRAVDVKGYTALHGAANIGDNELVKFLVEKGADVHAVAKDKNTVADIANGPREHAIPHPDTVALLESLGSANSHNCRSSWCVVAAQPDNGNRRGPAPAAAEKAAKTAPPPK